MKNYIILIAFLFNSNAFKMLNYSAKQEVLFWQTIQACHDISNVKMYDGLVYELSTWKDEDIIAFELILRDKIRLLYNWNCLAALVLKEIEFTDDNYLYYRFSIILQGKEFFYKYVENPDLVADEICYKENNGYDLWFGHVGFVDDAFEKKHGENTTLKMPRDYGYDFYKYDFIDDPLTGESLYHTNEFGGYLEAAKKRLPKLALCYDDIREKIGKKFGFLR